MNRVIPITTLLLDIGGVLLTNGWYHHARKGSAAHFKLVWAEISIRGLVIERRLIYKFD
jgi:putative hydrolase of the HAD superfamily